MNLNKLPHELEDSWHDNQRMDFLFSDFPGDVTSNPEHWKSKVGFWSKLIKELCVHSTMVCVDVNIVGAWLERKGKRPLGIEVVWKEMIRDGSLVLADEFVGDLARNSSWVGWGFNHLIRKPTLWVANKMLSPLKSLGVRRVEIKYVCIKAVEVKCGELFDAMIASNSHGSLHVISVNNLHEMTKRIVSDKNELDFLLMSLEKNRKVVVFSGSSDPNSERFVKFAKSSHDTVNALTECDLGVIRLEETRKRLHTQISTLYAQQSELIASAKQHVRRRERLLAKNALRHKQRLHASIAKKERSLDNVQQLLLRLEQCETDQTVMEAYRAGIAAYKQSSKEGGLTIGAVENTMEDLQSVLEDQDEVSTTISASVQGTDDEDELEKELETLLAHDVLPADEVALEFSSLTIPSHDPIIPSHDLSPRTNPTAAQLLTSSDNDLLSNQTDADIAKLVTGLSAVSMNSSRTADI